jgi:hypothetical protein
VGGFSGACPDAIPRSGDSHKASSFITQTWTTSAESRAYRDSSWLATVAPRVSRWDVEEEDSGSKLRPGTGSCCNLGWAPSGRAIRSGYKETRLPIARRGRWSGPSPVGLGGAVEPISIVS